MPKEVRQKEQGWYLLDIMNTSNTMGDLMRQSTGRLNSCHEFSKKVNGHKQLWEERRWTFKRPKLPTHKMRRDTGMNYSESWFFFPFEPFQEVRSREKVKNKWTAFVSNLHCKMSPDRPFEELDLDWFVNISSSSSQGFWHRDLIN